MEEERRRLQEAIEAEEENKIAELTSSIEQLEAEIAAAMAEDSTGVHGADESEESVRQDEMEKSVVQVEEEIRSLNADLAVKGQVAT